MRRRQTNLLIYDPRRPAAEYRAALADGGDGGDAWAAHWKRGVPTLRLAAYQLVFCAGLFSDAAARARSRVLRPAAVLGAGAGGLPGAC